MPTGNDDFGSADEVRIYKDEGEDDEQLHHASENLSEDKIGLVTETEKKAEECGNSRSNIQSAARCGQMDSNSTASNWPQNTNPTASFYSSLFSSPYNGILQQYRFQQFVNGLMSTNPSASAPTNGVLSMQMAMEAKRAERERDASSPQVLSPLGVPGCNSPMLSVLAAAMTGAISPVSSAPMHAHSTPSPRCATPGQSAASASNFRPFVSTAPTVNASGMSASWPFVNVPSANGPSSLMPPPASPFALAAMLQMQQMQQAAGFHSAPSQAMSAVRTSNGNSNGSLAAPLPPPPAASAAALTSTAAATVSDRDRSRTQRHDRDRDRDRDRRLNAHVKADTDSDRTVSASATSTAATASASAPASASASASNGHHRKIDAETDTDGAHSRLAAPNDSANDSAHSKHPNDSRHSEAANENDTKPSVGVSPSASASTSAAGVGLASGSTPSASQHLSNERKRPLDDDSDDSDDSDGNLDDSQHSVSSWSQNGDGDTSRDAAAHHGSQVGSPSSSAAQVRRWANVKKPLNAFMLFMKEQRAAVMGESTLKESAAINQLLGRKWHALERREQEKYYELARRVKEEHARLYPGWSARDNYALHSRRKKRRMLNSFAAPNAANSDRVGNPAGPAGPGPLELPGASARDCASPKKCRARYGLENQKEWCKPCRRKKKCIRFSAESERPLAPYGGQVKRPDPRTHELFPVNMLQSPFGLSPPGVPGPHSSSAQFPFGYHLNLEAYLKYAGGPYRAPFAGNTLVQPVRPNLPAFASAPIMSRTTHPSMDSGAPICLSPICGNEPAASSPASTTHRTEGDCDSLLSENDDQDPRRGRRPSRPPADEPYDPDVEKPVARTTEKDAPFAFDDEPSLSPLSVADDEPVPICVGSLVPARSCTLPLAANSLTLTTSGNTKRSDDDSQNNNSRNRAGTAESAATSSSNTTVSTTVSNVNDAAANNITRQTDSLADERLHAHATDRLNRIGAVECNAVN